MCNAIIYILNMQKVKLTGIEQAKNKTFKYRTSQKQNIKYDTSQKQNIQVSSKPNNKEVLKKQKEYQAMCDSVVEMFPYEV